MEWRVCLAARLRDLELEVEVRGTNQPLALVGPNGSGKTTVLRMIAGVMTPAEGVIELCGETLYDSMKNINVPPELRSVGYVPQGYGLFPHLSVLENVAFGLKARVHTKRSDDVHAVALAMLRELGCEHLADVGVGQLSGGERQRVALARALVTKPRLLALDEPLGALDVGVRRQVRAALNEHLKATARPAVITTHDVRDVVTLGCVVSVLERGKVVQTGSLAELRRSPVNAFVAEFVGAE